MDDTEFAITFFTALTVLANVAVVGLLVLASAARLTAADSAPGRAWRRLRQDLTPPVALGLAALVAGVATAGSLYFSESAGFTPCRLCWIQRGFMYPLVVVLLLTALATGRSPAGAPARWLRRLTVAAALAGGSVSVWHLLIERFPDLESATSCDIENPCSLIWFERLGFITLPYMALSGFLLIVTLVLMAAAGSRPAAGAHSGPAGRTRPAKHAKHARRPTDGADDRMPATTGPTAPPPAPSSPEACSTTSPASPGQQPAPPPPPPDPDLVTPTRTNGQAAH